jgi:hypothetical protein
MSEKPNPEAPDSYAVKVHSGSELTEADRAACLAILAAGAVNVQTASWELPRTKLMATVQRDNAIVGVGAIKRERPEYALEKAKLSGFDFDPNAPELGYVVDDSSAIHMTTKSILRARFFERLIWVILNMEDGRLWEIALTSVEI